MPALDNPRHELFAQKIAKGRTQREAYRSAGYITKSDGATDANASRLLSNAKVANRIRELQTEVAKSIDVTVISLIAETERARGLAESKDQASAMVSAITLKARLAGLLVDKTEDIVRRDELEERLQRKADLETTTAGRLLAEAAESLGWPSSAVAEDIVLAAGKRAYLPPALQKLLHAARLREEEPDDHR